ncbi:hypothetical protein TrCOL_g10854 [Triparma columacea]|uniref:Uncharacterized protein n=1 Tax=Triparma columacea TaxID=722753 RepID=A0A9W7G786_9STRA|nr:hypothetical protein TrCOL_g10854 [Triparma columacea]
MYSSTLDYPLLSSHSSQSLCLSSLLSNPTQRLSNRSRTQLRPCTLKMSRNELYTRATVEVGGGEGGGGTGGGTMCTATVQPQIVRVDEREPNCGSISVTYSPLYPPQIPHHVPSSPTLLTSHLQRLTSLMIDNECLCISEGNWCFLLNIEVKGSSDNGGMDEAACNAVVAALEGTRLPRLDLEGTEAVAAMPRHKSGWVDLPVKYRPVVVQGGIYKGGVGGFGGGTTGVEGAGEGKVVWDPDGMEGSVAEGWITIAYEDFGRVVMWDEGGVGIGRNGRAKWGEEGWGVGKERGEGFRKAVKAWKESERAIEQAAAPQSGDKRKGGISVDVDDAEEEGEEERYRRMALDFRCGHVEERIRSKEEKEKETGGKKKEKGKGKGKGVALKDIVMKKASVKKMEVEVEEEEEEEEEIVVMATNEFGSVEEGEKEEEAEKVEKVEKVEKEKEEEVQEVEEVEKEEAELSLSMGIKKNKKRKKTGGKGKK